MASFLNSLAATVRIDIQLDIKPTQKHMKVKISKGHYVNLPVYMGADDISGQINV